MNPVLNAALGRAFIISLLSGALVTITTRQLDVADVTPSWEECLLAGAVAFITAFLSRGFGEGLYDQQRAANGNINAGDVPVASDKVDVVVTG